jgi:two-component system, cell cycle response regulator DivK
MTPHSNVRAGLSSGPTASQPLPGILVVAGDEDSRLLYRTIFVDIAATVLEAEDGAEALGKAICHQPDVVVADSRLRRIDGFQLCGLLRREALTSAAGIVIITCDGSLENIEQAAVAGADEVVVKPCLPDVLINAAYQSWRRRRAAAIDPVRNADHV